VSSVVCQRIVSFAVIEMVSFLNCNSCISEQKPEVNEHAVKEDGSDDLDFEDAREENDADFDDNSKDDDDDDQLMVIETPEGLTLVEPTENSSFYIVQENEGEQTPPGIIVHYGYS